MITRRDEERDLRGGYGAARAGRERLRWRRQPPGRSCGAAPCLRRGRVGEGRERLDRGRRRRPPAEAGRGLRGRALAGRTHGRAAATRRRDRPALGGRQALAAADRAETPPADVVARREDALRDGG